MGMLLTQEFKIVRRKIDDEQAPARTQHARRLRNCPFRIVEEVQDLMDDDDVEAVARERQVVDVAEPTCVRATGPVQTGARDRQHVGRRIEADAAMM